MVCACYLLFQATYFILVLGYPLKCLYESDKKGKIDGKWIYYFFFITVLFLCEFTVLFPLKWLLGKIDFCMFPTLKALFSLWLYYPCDKNGIKIIESLTGDKLEKAFVKINGIVGKFSEKIGIENKIPTTFQRKIE